MERRARRFDSLVIHQQVEVDDARAVADFVGAVAAEVAASMVEQAVEEGLRGRRSVSTAMALLM